jgi:Redoxin
MNSQVDTPDWSKIPAPTDDGAARHLTGMRIPSVSLPATDGTTVDLSVLTGLVVVYAYPRTGRPGVENPDGWDLIPGARGCTPQSCSFRDHFGELKSLGVDHLFGLSTQVSAYSVDAGGDQDTKRQAACKWPRSHERTKDGAHGYSFSSSRVEAGWAGCWSCGRRLVRNSTKAVISAGLICLPYAGMLPPPGVPLLI